MIDENKLRELALCVQAAWDWNNAAETMREHSEAYQAWVKAREALERAANPAAVLSLLDTLAALRAERDALVADARRWQHAKKEAHWTDERDFAPGGQWWIAINVRNGRPTLEEAVDAAIAKEPTR